MMNRFLLFVGVTTLVAMTPIHASDVTTCTTSEGDQNAGILAFYDSSCSTSGGDPVHGFLGCFEGLCRFCKSEIADAAQPYIDCPVFDPDSLDLCETADTDKQVGVFGFYDDTCTTGTSPDGLLGCFNDGLCRHCQAFETDLSDHLVACPDTVVGLCETSAGDQQAGVFAYYDESCGVQGGDATIGILGCYTNVCRHCQKATTAQSGHLVACPP